MTALICALLCMPIIFGPVIYYLWQHPELLDPKEQVRREFERQRKGK